MRRRDFVSLAGCGCAAISVPASGLAQRYEGCRLSVSAYADLRAVDTFAYAGGQRGGGSGDRVFDRALAETLLRLSQEFGVSPRFSFFDERQGENAYASPTEPHGEVAYGRGLIGRQRREQARYDVHVIGVCAHEFAHIAQFARGTNDTLNRGTGTVKRSELHADYLAGWFAGLRKRERPSFPAAEIAQALYNVGDNRVWSRDHHGTHEERGEAVRNGFGDGIGGAMFDTAFQRGFDWARRM